jgi:hypothetical protein
VHLHACAFKTGLIYFLFMIYDVVECSLLGLCRLGHVFLACAVHLNDVYMPTLAAAAAIKTYGFTVEN